LQGCDGIYVEDLQGRRYMDFHGNNVHQVGFGNPRVIDAITEQMKTLSFCTRRYTNIPAIQLAEKLTELAPGNLNKVLFAPGGTLAIGMALKLARAATGRFKTISMWDSFHGASLDAISSAGKRYFAVGLVHCCRARNTRLLPIPFIAPSSAESVAASAARTTSSTCSKKKATSLPSLPKPFAARPTSRRPNTGSRFAPPATATAPY